MSKKGQDLIFESFEDRKSALVVGFLCLVYLGLFYTPAENSWIAKVLPFWPLNVFGGIVLGTLVLQLIVWKIFRHFYPRWYLKPLTLLLFICEFGLILFTVMFFSWPVYWLYSFIAAKHTPI